MSSYIYWGNCSQSTYEDITLLQESAKRVSWRSFKKAIPDAREMLEKIGAIWPETTNKQIEHSDFLDFKTGIFMGRPAYFIDWSAIEWIWVKAESNPIGSIASPTLLIASVSLLAFGIGSAIRSAKMQRRRDPGPGRTAAIGNSITASSTGYVSFLGREMPSRTFVNMGVVGEGTAAIKRRLERNVIGQQFDEVIIEAGINDIRRNDASTYIPSQLAEMVRIAKQSGLKVVLTTLPPWRGAVSAIASVNNSIKRDGKFWGADVVVDIHRPLADWRGHLRGELVGDQMGLHPNRQGQELIGRAILEQAYSQRR
jgi:lysophospholipase L1-like esterase